jgi:hypothetical protein
MVVDPSYVAPEEGARAAKAPMVEQEFDLDPRDIRDRKYQIMDLCEPLSRSLNRWVMLGHFGSLWPIVPCTDIFQGVDASFGTLVPPQWQS